MQQINMRPASIILVLLGLALISALVFGLLGAYLAHLIYPHLGLTDMQNMSLEMTKDKKHFMMIVQNVSSIGGFFLPIVIISRIFEGATLPALLPIKKVKPILLLASVPFLFLGIQVLISLLHNLNQLIPFSDAIMQREAANLKIQELFINGNSSFDLVISLLVVALLPAIVEEVFFRGALQQLFLKTSNNMHVAVLVQAILFALIHFNATQILPIMVIGLMFGYMAVYSGNLIYGMIVHFLNNAGAVILMFYKDKTVWAKYLDTEDNLSLPQYAIGMVLLLIGVYLFFMMGSKNANKNVQYS